MVILFIKYNFNFRCWDIRDWWFILEIDDLYVFCCEVDWFIIIGIKLCKNGVIDMVFVDDI